MQDDQAAPADGLRPTPLRAVKDGSIPDGAQVVLHGMLADVGVMGSEQAGDWASGRIVDGPDSIEFLIFPRAFARSDGSFFCTGQRVTVTARLSFSAERITLVVNSIRLTHDSEPGRHQTP